MKFENEKRKRDDSDIVTLSRHEANKFVDILKIIMKSSRIDGKFRWLDKGADDKYTTVQVCVFAEIHKNEDITPETLASLMVSVADYIFINDIIKVQGEEA